MTEKIQRPAWYNENFYNKERSPEEWLFEILKRDKFNRDDLELPVSIRLLPAEEIKKCFLDIIFFEDIKGFLVNLQPTPSQPIRHLSISDVFRMASLISNSDWYKNHPDKRLFESAITAIANEQRLTKEQKAAFNKMYDTPWCTFHENSKDKSWYPNKDIAFLSGVPSSIDPGYAKKDIVRELKNRLTRWVGKLQDIELKFDFWKESRILAVFDLMTWFQIQNLKYSKIDIHELIWPKGRLSKTTNEYTNPNDDIDHLIDLVNRVISRDVIRTLSIMCEARKHREQITPA